MSFEGVCVNYRHPDPRRGEPRVGSAPDVPFPLDPLQNSTRLSNAVFYNDFGTFCRNWGPSFGSPPRSPCHGRPPGPRAMGAPPVPVPNIKNIRFPQQNIRCPHHRPELHFKKVLFLIRLFSPRGFIIILFRNRRVEST